MGESLPIASCPYNVSKSWTSNIPLFEKSWKSLMSLSRNCFFIRWSLQYRLLLGMRTFLVKNTCLRASNGINVIFVNDLQFFKIKWRIYSWWRKWNHSEWGLWDKDWLTGSAAETSVFVSVHGLVKIIRHLLQRV